VGDAVCSLGFAPLSFLHGHDGEDDEWGRTDHELLVCSFLAEGVSAGDRKPTLRSGDRKTAHIKIR
jgi:hypothetical protein